MECASITDTITLPHSHTRIFIFEVVEASKVLYLVYKKGLLRFVNNAHCGSCSLYWMLH